MKMFIDTANVDHKDDVSVVHQKRIGKQAPHLALQDQGTVKHQPLVQQGILRRYSEQVHQGRANGDIQHQIGDTPIAVLETKTFETGT